jgi:putative serine protease PepD
MRLSAAVEADLTRRRDDGTMKTKALLGVCASSAVLAGATAAALVSTAAPGGGTTTVVRTAAGGGSAAPAARTASTPTLGAVYRSARAGVVKIVASGVSTSGAGGFGAPSGTATSEGTGFMIDRNGHIVTNDHVVAGASAIRVTLAGGRTFTATLVGTNASQDIAVLRIAAPSGLLHPLQLADSSTVQVGDTVLAIGNPYGLTGTATAGIVSALDRTITAENGGKITGAIQTDAAINSGNSGGPLLNAAGLVVGIDSQIESRSGGNVGIGFAIASNTVKDVVGQILAGS